MKLTQTRARFFSFRYYITLVARNLDIYVENICENNNFRYEDYAVVKTTRDSVQEVIQEKINEFSHWQKLHKVSPKSL